MAKSGSFSGAIFNNYFTLRVDWTAAQSVANNTSTITLVPYLVMSSGSSLQISARAGNAVKINGANYSYDAAAINGKGLTVKLSNGITSAAVAHNADGTKSVSVTVEFNIKATLAGTYYEKITATATLTLDTIPRATTPTLSADSVDMGGALRIYTPRASESFTHDLAYAFAGGGWVSIGTGVTTSKDWTVPDLATSVPSATSGVMTIRCITKNGSTTIGTKTVTLTVKVPTSVVPEVTGVTVTEAVEGLAEQFGVFIQNKSKVTVTTTGKGIKGSSITAYWVELLGVVYQDQSWTSGLLTTAGTLDLVAWVKDSRGRWSAPTTIQLQVHEYQKPQIEQFAAYRVDANGNAATDGQYIAVRQKYSVTAINGKNTAQAKVQYRRSIDGSYSDLLSSTALAVDNTVKPASPTFSVDYSYEIVLTLRDWFGNESETTADFIIPTDEVIVDFKENGKGLAIGKTSEHDGVEFGWEIVGNECTEANKQGKYKTHDGLLLQWGTIDITPTASNTTTLAVVTYPEAYEYEPQVFLSVHTSAPDTTLASMTRYTVEDSRTQIGVAFNRSGTNTTTVNWLAIGIAKK